MATVIKRISVSSASFLSKHWEKRVKQGFGRRNLHRNLFDATTMATYSCFSLYPWPNLNPNTTKH